MATEIRIELIREATNELWVKMADMQAGMPLNSGEWQIVLDRLNKRIETLQISGEEWKGSG